MPDTRTAEPLPVGAYVASALMAANIPCDSGEDVDRFLGLLAERGYHVVAHQEAADTSGLDFVATAQRIRSEHEATHGEAEMCGGECIVLGLCDDDQEAADTSGLRAAASALVDEWDAAMAGDMPLDGHYQKQALDRLRAALAQQPTPATGTEGLDVGRLAKALLPRHLFGHPGWNCDGGVDERYAEEMAAIIAAEYAALGTPR